MKQVFFFFFFLFIGVFMFVAYGQTKKSCIHMIMLVIALPGK